MPQPSSPRARAGRVLLEPLEPKVLLDAGLTGEYFDTHTLLDLKTVRVDAQVDFDDADWSAGAPAGTAVTPDNYYSERWTGFVKIDTAGTWTFQTLSNDGVRLWVNDELVVDQWTMHAATEHSGSLSLAAGWHPIRLEHFQHDGAVAIRLSFSGPGRAQTVIPATHLSTTDPDGTVPAPQPSPGVGGTVTGELRQWHKVTVSFDGPATSETAATNPFLDYRLNVTFTSPSGRKVVVPGYYAADGNAAQTSAGSGSVWRAHLAPDEVGTWTYAASFRTGANVAVSGSATAGTATGFDGASGSFAVGATNKTGADFRGKGLLEYTGQRYLQFAGTGEWFLKGGADSPENFLAYYEFDGTPAKHYYAPHAGDWKAGDPTWQNGKGKNIVGALNYLASEGMNSVYFLTMNVNGDGKDVWPWTTSSERVRFDVSKLDQWEIVFEHMDRLGLQLHVVTQEMENDQLLNNGSLGTERMLYYRELVARFGHHLAVTWNLGEENSNTDAQRKAYATYFKGIDPYDHPVVVHTYPGQQDTIYTPLLGYADFEGSSLQTTATHAETLKWVERSASAGRPWIVTLDEIAGATTGVKPDSYDPGHDSVRKEHLWGNLMAGGAGVEWYFGYSYPHADLNCEDWRSRDLMWDQTRYALEFFQGQLAFERMLPADGLTAATSDYVLAEAGQVYAVYLPSGGTTTLTVPAGGYSIQWYDPRSGGTLRTGSVATATTAGGTIGLGYAPSDTSQDWVALVRRTSGEVEYRAPENPAGAVAGLEASYYLGSWSQLPDYDALSAQWTQAQASFDISTASSADNLGFRFRGYVSVPADGLYTFYTTSDDGSRLYIGEQLVVDNDGVHAAQERSGQIGLRAGLHAITVEYFEKTGGQTLTVAYAGPGIAKQAIPAGALYRVGAVATNQAPVVTAGSDAQVSLSSPTLALSGSASDDGLPTGGSLTTRWLCVEGPGSVAFGDVDACTTTATFTAAGTYVLCLTASDGQYTSTDEITVQVAAAPSGGGAAVYRINAGGPALTGWEADRTSPYVNHTLAKTSTYSTGATINMSHASIPAGTPMAIFQTERWDSSSGAEMQWDLPVTAGQYQVRLYFAEIYFTAAGKRAFDVSIEGQQVLNDYDVYADVGYRTGVVKTFTVTSDGNLDIDFARVQDNPAIKGIEVVAVDGGTVAPSTLGASAASADFGTVVTGNTASRTITLTNTGAAGSPDIVIASTRIVGTDAAMFSDTFADGSNARLAPGQSVSLTVRFSPTATGSRAATLEILHDGANSPLAVALAGTGSTTTVTPTPVYRINAGGPALTGWEADRTSPYVNHTLAKTSTYSTGATINMSHASIPAGTPMAIFQTERWDSSSGAEMQWDLPVTAGQYQVRLYFAEIYFTAAGKRAFDVSIEGQQVLNDYDVYADVGYRTGVVKTFTVTSDGNLDIDFARVQDNPAIKGIEVIAL